MTAPVWAQQALAKDAKRRKAPQKKVWKPSCRHCFLLVPAETDGVVLVKCAHCVLVRSKLTLALLDQPKVLAMCGETRRAHARLCERARR